jgi:hypothetical protein
MENTPLIVRLSALVKRLREFSSVQDGTECPLNAAEVRDLLAALEFDGQFPRSPYVKVQPVLTEESVFRFKAADQLMVYGLKTAIGLDDCGHPPCIDTSKVEWREISDGSVSSVSWTETKAEGWTRRRESVLNLSVPAELRSPDRLWVVIKIERKQSTGDTGVSIPVAGSTGEEIYVTSVTEHDVHGDGRMLRPVICRFFLGENRRGGRPLSSIEMVIKEKT